MALTPKQEKTLSRMNTKLIFDAMTQASKREQAKPPKFLKAWKDGVHLAGTHYFGVTYESVGQATCVDQLCPNLNTVFQVVCALSGHERVFILSLCQFYCDSDVRAGCEKHGLIVPSLPDIANLDDERRSVIVALLDNYTGW